MRALRTHGGDPIGALADADLTESDIERADVVIPVDRFLKFMESCEQASMCQNIGLRAGQELRLEDLDIVGLFMRSLNRVGDVHENAMRYAELWPAGHDVQLVNLKGGFAARHVRPSTSQPTRTWAEYFVARVVSAGRTLIGNIEPLEVHFTHTSPTDTSEHTALFRCPIHFDQAHDQAIYSYGVLAKALPSADRTVARILAPHLESLRRRGALMPADLTSRLKGIVSEAIVSSKLTSSYVASRLFRGERTMRRQLGELGTSYRALVDEVRRELALKYLHRGYSAADVANMIGFSEPSVFYRAFKRWTGRSIRESRKE